MTVGKIMLGRPVYQSSPSFSLAGTSITLGLSMILAVLGEGRVNKSRHHKNRAQYGPVPLLDDPDDPGLVSLHLLDVLAVGSRLLPDTQHN